MAIEEATPYLYTISDVDHLDMLLSAPTVPVIEVFSRLEGDLILLGVAGKMGPTLAWMARRAFDATGKRERRVIGVSRFSDPRVEAWLNKRGIETIHADLLDPAALDALPDVPNVISMFAMKFGTTGQEGRTWAMNAVVPAQVALKYRHSKIVAFSTGNVYAPTPPSGGGSKETDELRPVGEYGMSCLGRERVLTYYSQTLGIPMALIRLNYAVEMRYGVLVDLARWVRAGKPIDLSAGYFNIIWQADANAYTLRAFDHLASPAAVLNVTGPEILSVRTVAERFGERFNQPVTYTGTEAPIALLNNASQCMRLFGPPRFDPERLIDLTADWLMRDGPTLDKPTHFEVSDGQF